MGWIGQTDFEFWVWKFASQRLNMNFAWRTANEFSGPLSSIDRLRRTENTNNDGLWGTGKVPGGYKGCCFRDFAKGLKTLRKRLGFGGGAVEKMYAMAASGRIHFDYKQTNNNGLYIL
jgi:hypothetical protein